MERIRNPGSGMEKIGIRDKHPGFRNTASQARCVYNLLAYTAHTLQKRRISDLNNLFLNCLCTAKKSSTTHTGLDCVKKPGDEYLIFKYLKSKFGWAFVPQLVQVINMIRKIQPRYLTVSHLPKMSLVPGYLILTEMIIRNSVYLIYERARSDCNIPLLYLMTSYLTVHTKKT